MKETVKMSSKLTEASFDRPNRCSSAAVVPSAFAMTAPRPKNIRAELK